jgi:tRNA 2-thiouridine synthesizing protein E
MSLQQKLIRDSQGYLKNTSDWTEAIAKKIAEEECLTLNNDYWIIITTLRNFYLTHGLLPPMRGLIKILSNKIPPEKNNSLYLQSLFPKGFMRQASKISGLPKPVRCI